MSVPYNDDTRESYIERHEDGQLWMAKRHCEMGNELSMWQALFFDVIDATEAKLKEKNT